MPKKIDGKTSDQWSDIGFNYLFSKDFHNAIESYENAVKINPQNRDAWNNLGYGYFNLKDYNKAIECYDQAIKIDPQYSKAYYNIGNAHINLKDYQKAIEYFNKTVEIDPQDYEASNLLKKCRFKSELFDYIAPYDEISFEKLANHFYLEKTYIEDEIKEMLQSGSIKGSLVSDRIKLREQSSRLGQTIRDITPPNVELTALKCPNCKSPLENTPPCKCEYCGVMIESKK